ncbi:MAG: FapA family protein [Leptospirales bacterium]|nr:FapA family protein [Leptospirales bacterium]
MEAIKDFFRELGTSSDKEEDALEVYADSLKQALELAAAEFKTEVSMLDYDILEKGADGIFGIGRKPYHVLVKLIPLPKDDAAAMAEFAKKLAPGLAEFQTPEPEDVDAAYKIRVTRSGTWFTAYPPKGAGAPLDLEAVRSKFNSMKITNANLGELEKAVNNMSGAPVRLGDYDQGAHFYDAKMNLDISSDEMSVRVHFVPPRFNGRHMEHDEIVTALKHAGVIHGIKDDQIKEYLENMDYSRPLLAAEGEKAVNGKDAYIDYRVRIDRSEIKMEEDDSGKVDFRNLDLLENVTAGQLLAVKIPKSKGIPGHTVTGKVVSVKETNDITLQHGEGTILSADGDELTAQINGQVVYKQGIIMVDPVHTVRGDVGLETGNINFLGSVIITGSVQDNFVVKASGNIEVKGTIQKAVIESEGDIIVAQGISGRDEAQIISTGGSVIAKFIQNANVSAEKDVFSPEGIMHSKIDAGERVLCRGKRARIVGGLIRAGNEVNARVIGANVSTKTEIHVGIDPKLLQNIFELEQQKEENLKELAKIDKELPTLVSQNAAGKLNEEKKQLFQEMKDRKEKLEERNQEIDADLKERNDYLETLEYKGKICVEDTIYHGVDIFVNTEKFPVKDEYHFIKFSRETDGIKLSEYELPEITDKRMVITSSKRR